jgi:hypothetical protein
MMTVYFGILAIGIIAIIIIYTKENKGSHSSAVDILNSLDVDENLKENQTALSKASSSDFLRRLNLEEEKNKNPNVAIKDSQEQQINEPGSDKQATLDKKSSENNKTSDQI